MSKYLFFNVPAYGHVNATLPLITELHHQGHEVINYNAPTFKAVLAPTGACFRSYPDSVHMEAELTRRAVNLPAVTVGLLNESLRLIPFVVAEIEKEQPDKVIFDGLALWGLQAAILQNVPTVASVTTFFMEGVRGILTWRDFGYILRHSLTQLPQIIKARHKLVKAYGSAIFPHTYMLPATGDQTVFFTARDFHPNSQLIDESFYFVGPSISPTSRTDLNFPWSALDLNRPKIFLSLGTIYNNRPDFFTAVMHHFKHHPAQFILATGARIEISELQPIPSNFIVQNRVPQIDLLPHVDLFISHGGVNSILESLYFGVPLLIIPQQIEQAINGRFVAQQRAGIVVADTPPYGRFDIEEIQNAVDRLLNTPGYREQAKLISQTLQSAGGYQEAVRIITSSTW